MKKNYYFLIFLFIIPHGIFLNKTKTVQKINTTQIWCEDMARAKKKSSR